MKDNLSVQYRLRFEKNIKYRYDVWKILVSDFFLKYIPENSALLDLGCGYGFFINNIKSARKYGMDLNSEVKNHLNENVDFINQDCSEKWKMEDNTLDIVFTSNFLEHLSDKHCLEKTIFEIKRCLKPEGKIIILCPNIKYLNGLFWDFWDHHIPVTENSISELLKINDFKINICIPKFLPFRMSNNKKQPAILIKLYLKIPFLWRIFGKQFLIVATNKK